MALQNYITTSDITSTVASDFSLSGYVTRANDHYEYIGSTLDISPSGLVYPVRPLAKEYLIAYTYRQLYLDKLGVTNEAMADKYMNLYETFNREVDRMRGQLTPEVVGLSGNLGAHETASSSIVFRG